MKALFVVLLLAGPAGAQTWHPFVSLDLVAAGNSKTHADSDVTATCNTVIASGGTGCSASETVYGAIGPRVGAFYSQPDVDLGGSFSYWRGGPGQSKNSLTVAAPAGSASADVNDNTFRFLAEAKKTLAGTDNAHLSINAGLGLAVVDESVDNCSASGSLTAICSQVGSPTLGWATWELGPSVWVHHFTAAFRYVGFARGGNLPWNTFGLSLGYEF